MLNRVCLIGRLTKNLELRTSTNGKKYVAFTVAVNSSYNNNVNFINCFAWNKIAENMAKYLSKGSLISIDGSINSRTVKTNEGNRTVLDVNADRVSFLDKMNTNKTENNVKEDSKSTDEKNNTVSFEEDDILWD